jgi:hypothetical protein
MPSPTQRRKPVFAYLVAAGMLGMGAYGAARGMPQPLNLLLAAGGVMVLIGLGRPLYRAAVYRTGPQEIRCRLIPWYQPNMLVVAVMFPIIGAIAIVMGREPNVPVWLLRYGGYFLVVLGALVAVVAVLTWAFNLLCITPSGLSVRILRRWRRIPRANVLAVTPRTLASGATRQPTLHVDLAYTPADGDSQTPRTFGLIDTQFSVDPANLLHALQAWKDGDPNDPGLMDRVEAILRGQAP